MFFMKFLRLKKIRKKLVSDVIFSYRHRIVRLKKYRRFLPYLHRLGLIVILAIVVFLTHYFFIRADIANFYPASCLGGWQNPQNAQGLPESTADSNFGQFNENNSAVYDGKSISQIFCGNFQGKQSGRDFKSAKLKIAWNIIPKITLQPIELQNGGLEENAAEILEIPPEEPVNFILATSTPFIAPESPKSIDQPASSSPSSFLIKSVYTAEVYDASTTVFFIDDLENILSLATSSPIAVNDDATSSADKIDKREETEQNGGLENFLEIAYSFDGVEWQTLAKINQENWTNAEFELPIQNETELNMFQIRFQILPTVNELPQIYLDGLGVEIEYENAILNAILNQDDDEFKNLDNLPKINIEEEKIFKDSKEVFGPMEEPIFEIQPFPTELPNATSSASFLKTIQKLFFPKKAYAKELRIVKAQVFDINGQKVNFEPFPQYENGKTLIKIPKVYAFKPGKYTLKVELTDGQKIFLSSKNFEWGVLALNFNKSIYQANEIVRGGIAVLDKNGHTICNAKIDLSISAPDGNITKFSTTDGSIEKGLECGPNTITIKPDYYFTFQANKIGIYQVVLAVQTSEGAKTINDNFEAREKMPFSVERIGPIRIWPLADYRMKIIIKTYEDYKGTVREIVPAVFDVLKVEGDYAYYQIKPGTLDAQMIDMEVDFKANQTYALSYEFNPPDISPEFYLLGPFQFTNFKEARQWQIASDAVTNGATLVYGDSTDDGNLNFRNYTAPSTLGSELTTATTSASDIAFVKIAAAPTREEKIAVHQKTDGRMDILTCTSGCDNTADWTLRATLSTLITTVDAMPTKRRPFDVAYEQLSGKAIIVFSEASTNGKAYYCIWDGVSWSPSSNCGATITPGAGNEISLTVSNKIAWLRLVPRGGRLTSYRGNELLFGAASNDYELHLGRWTGSAWVNGTNPTNALTSLDGQIFNLAWEEISGRGLAIWDATTSATNLQFSIYTPDSGWSSTQTGPAKASTGAWKWVETASNPNGNEISTITGDSLSDAEIYIWNGSTWTKGAQDLTAESLVGKHVDTKWTRFTNRALYLWTDTNALTSDMICWTSSGFSSILSDIGNPNISNTDDVEDIFLIASPNNNEMLLTRHDIADDLKLLRYSAVSGCADADWNALGGVLNGAVEGVSNNTTRLAHGISYTPYSPWSRNWRWTSDTTNLTPSSWLSNENTAPLEISSGQNLRIRINIAETTNQGQTDSRKKLQYSTSSSETAVWSDVDAQGGSGIWRYCDGPGTDDALIPVAVLTGSDAVGPFVENGTAASNYDHTALTTAEWDFCVQNNGADSATTYYFRAWDNSQQSLVFREQTPGASYTYPSLTTAGITLTVTFSSNTANFGSVSPGSATATSTIITVETANSSGFNIKVNRDDNDTTMDLNTDASVNIADRTNWVSSGSGNATVWLSGDKHLGFRVNQQSTDSSNYNSTWWGTDDTDTNAKFAGFPPVAALNTIVNRTTASSPPADTKMLYKINVENSQKTGGYSGGITYTITVNP